MRKVRFLTGVILISSAAMFSVAEVPAAYKQCVNCHGTDGRGRTAYATKTPTPDLHSSAVQDLSDSDLYDTIARGNKHHNYPHAYLLRGMKDQDIRMLVDYIRTMRPQAK